MAFLSTIKNLFKKQEPKPVKEKRDKKEVNRVSVLTMEKKYETEDLVSAAKELKILLEFFGQRKKQNHKYKGREFISFILSNKHKDLKNTGYMHWQNLNQVIQLNQAKVYPYHKNNLRNAMTFFETEIKGIYSFDIELR